MPTPFAPVCAGCDGPPRPSRPLHPTIHPPRVEEFTMSAAAQPRPEIRYGLTPAHELAGLSGLEFLQGLIEGRFPAPPVSQTAGFHIVEAREGEVVFEGEPTASFLNPLGTIHGGWT